MSNIKNTKLYRTAKFYKDVLVGRNVFYKINAKLNKLYLGGVDCGFYVIPAYLNEKSIVYSCGVGEDISFDEGVIQQFGCKVYAFDPTPRAKVFVSQHNHLVDFVFYDYGIANYDGVATFYFPENPDYDMSCTTYNRWGYDEAVIQPIQVPVKKLSTIMKELGHDHIDLLKMDIESSEYEVVPDMLNDHLDVKQIAVEVHHRFANMGIGKTKEMFSSLQKAGYKIAAISDTRLEYTFVK
jgi:FkbM family methyltransferase